MTDKLRAAAEMVVEALVNASDALRDGDDVGCLWILCEQIYVLRQALDQLPDTTEMIEPSEQDKVDRDVLMYGQGFMKDGKHIPLHDVIIDRGAWSDVPDATKWVDELRGGEDLEEPPNSTTDVVEREWQGLTDEEKSVIRSSAAYSQFMTAGEYAEKVQDATEAKLKEKNT